MICVTVTTPSRLITDGFDGLKLRPMYILIKWTS